MHFYLVVSNIILIFILLVVIPKRARVKPWGVLREPGVKSKISDCKGKKKNRDYQTFLIEKFDEKKMHFYLVEWN